MLSRLLYSFACVVTAALPANSAGACGDCDIYVPDQFPTIQAAIDAAANQQTICVRPGTYYERIDFLGKAITVCALNGPTETIIDAEGDGTAVLIITGERADTVLSGFTITNGVGEDGGGLLVHNASPIIYDCIFANNTATEGPQEPGGGGARIVAGSPTFFNCLFENNTAADDGAGMLILNSPGTFLVNCIFRDHIGSADGAGVYARASTMKLVNCMFFNNHVIGGRFSAGGGIVNNTGSEAMLVNCTLANNHADHGGGIYNGTESTATLRNCILWGNASDQIDDTSGLCDAQYSCVEGGWPGEGNIDQDPRFINPASGNLRLGEASPCVDAGDSTAVPSGVLVDLDMNGRFADDRQVEDVGVPFGIPPVVVDMGAYERRGCPWDIDGDGDVDTADLLALLAHWGACP